MDENIVDEIKEILKDKFAYELVEAICPHTDDIAIDINALKKFGIEIGTEGSGYERDTV